MSSFRPQLASEQVQLGGATWLSEVDAARIEGLLTTRFPWRGYHIDWQSVPLTVHLDWGSATDAQASAFVRGVAVSRSKEVTLLYSRHHALRVSSIWLAGNVTEAGFNAQQYFAIGGTVETPDLNAIAEFESCSNIWAHAT